jgi:hypothetical protein
VTLNTAAVLSVVEPPNYRDTPYRFGKMCQNCKFKDEQPLNISCKKYGGEVMPD